MEKKLWFKAKRYGYGWTPCSWEGWLITYIYLIFLVAMSITFNIDYSTQEVLFKFIIPISIASFLFIGIAYKNGERLGWRWGNKKTL
ncbi:MAG: hypothetical protein WCT07_01820 [Candidatus Paceibacterota bacterium]|jgi:hypothetical protein